MPIRTIAALLALVLVAAAPAEELRFTIAEGAEHNVFFRSGPAAAHLALKRSGPARLVVAFPAGNSGVGLWFADRVDWGPVTSVRRAERSTPAGPLHGITAELTANSDVIEVRQAVLSNVRVLRDYGYTGAIPAAVAAKPVVGARSVSWSRPRLDGGAGYVLIVETLNGRVEGGGAAPVRLVAEDAPLRLRVTALSGDRPLTPLDDLFTEAAAPDQRLRDVLAFLSYGEKLNAGSWRYNTYFGRDTLMSLRLLDRAITPAVWEAGLGAVLERLSEQGEVAHEEDIGEFAVLRRLAAGEKASATPLFDYKMVDDDFMLAPVAAHYLLGQGRERAAAFLERRTPSGERYGDALARNLRFVMRRAAPFAAAPEPRNLIALAEGAVAGDWRDSEDGLGGGRYSFSVNGVFVPAALRAVVRLAGSGFLTPYLGGQGFADAERMAGVWSARAPERFLVTVPADEARRAVAAYASTAAVDGSAGLAEIERERPVRFHAVALDGEGRPIPIVNSDVGLWLLFADPPEAEVSAAVEAALRRFPAGLMTDAGMVVANPAYAAPALWPRFDRHHYHGAVIWSWQQAVMAAALDRQRARADLSQAAHARLGAAQGRLWAAIEAARSYRSAELWSFRQSGDRQLIVPYGADSADETESNAAQLWSTVFLGLKPPR